MDLLADVEASFAVREAPDGTWSGPNVAIAGYKRLYGGQLLAQALGVAAAWGGGAGGRLGAIPTAPKHVRSVQAIFCAEGVPGVEVSWSLEALSSGRSFATCSLIARQSGRVLASALSTLHAIEDGVSHQAPMPVVPAVGELASIPPGGALPVELKVVGDVSPDGLGTGAPELALYLRPPRHLAGDTQLAPQQLVAYCSDGTMMATAMRPHEGVGYGAPGVLATAVTAHSVTFHRGFSFDDWMLFTQESPSSHGARAYVRGDFWSAEGELVASCTQEVLMRVAR